MWNHSFPSLKLSSSDLNCEEETANSRIKLGIFDADGVSNSLVGDTSIELKVLCGAAGQRKWFPIFYKKKLAGEIMLEVSLNAASPSRMPAPKPLS